MVLVEGFWDPNIYRKRRGIAVAGDVFGQKMRSLRRIEYRYPHLFSKQIQTWRKYCRRYPSPYFPRYPWRDYADDGSIVAKK